MLKKAYLEITNVCNLSCGFCHGTKRDPHFLSVEEFRTLAQKLRGQVQVLFFHLIGEPLLHPELAQFFSIAAELGFQVNLTTNGTLLPERASELLQAPSLHKVSISLHCYESNSMDLDFDAYLAHCIRFCKDAAQKGIIAVLRLWNLGGAEQLNRLILEQLHHAFPLPWQEGHSAQRLTDRVFLEWGERFDWPDLQGQEFESSYGCYGLRDQIGILCDGTVVPCCLDAEGAIPLGNLFRQELADILAGERAATLKRSLQNRKPCEALCRRCGYAHQKQY